MYLHPAGTNFNCNPNPNPNLNPATHTIHIAVPLAQDSLNFYSEMFTMKGPDGKELFRNIQVGLACAACVAAGKADECEHNQDEIPLGRVVRSLTW